MYTFTIMFVLCVSTTVAMDQPSLTTVSDAPCPSDIQPWLGMAPFLPMIFYLVLAYAGMSYTLSLGLTLSAARTSAMKSKEFCTQKQLRDTQDVVKSLRQQIARQEAELNQFKADSSKPEATLPVKGDLGSTKASLEERTLRRLSRREEKIAELAKQVSDLIAQLDAKKEEIEKKDAQAKKDKKEASKKYADLTAVFIRFQSTAYGREKELKDYASNLQTTHLDEVTRLKMSYTNDKIVELQETIDRLTRNLKYEVTENLKANEALDELRSSISKIEKDHSDALERLSSDKKAVELQLQGKCEDELRMKVYADSLSVQIQETRDSLTADVCRLNREKHQLVADVERLNEEKKNAAAQTQQLRSEHAAEIDRRAEENNLLRAQRRFIEAAHARQIEDLSRGKKDALGLLSQTKADIRQERERADSNSAEIRRLTQENSELRVRVDQLSAQIPPTVAPSNTQANSDPGPGGYKRHREGRSDESASKRKRTGWRTYLIQRRIKKLCQYTFDEESSEHKPNH